MGQVTRQTITVGSRPSTLARLQTGTIVKKLEAIWPNLTFTVVTLVTEGDKRLDRPLPEIGGKGVFTAELESALRSGEIDLAVHSLKDLPVDLAPDLAIGAVDQRGDARDALISAQCWTLAQLPSGARVGTSSLRRQAQLKAARPDLVIQPLRGNVDTRVLKALEGNYDAIVLAVAGLERAGLNSSITQFLPFEVMLPAPGQGALAVQCRADDDRIRSLLQRIHHLPTFRAVTSERSFLSALGGGCSAPVAAYAEIHEATLHLSGLVASMDGQKVIRVSASGEDSISLGKHLAQVALGQGAGELLGEPQR